MADSIRADRDVSGGGRRKARDEAEKVFTKPGVDSRGPIPEPENPEGKAPPRILPNLATDGDMQRMFGLVKGAEATYEAELAKIREQKTAAKTVRDKALSDAADAMKSRGISKRLFTELVAMSKRKPEENTAEIKAYVWAIRAIGMPVGSQLAFFDDVFQSEDEALRLAYTKGYDAFTDRKDSKENPFHPSSKPGQEWLRGWQTAHNEAVPGAQH